METGISRAAIVPDSDERFVALRRQLGVSSFGINQINLAPRQRGRIHRHERQEEVYLVLEGILTVVVEGDEHALAAGELMRVGPELRRQLVNASDAPVVVVAFGGAGEHQGRDGMAYPDWETEQAVPPQELPLPGDLPAG